MRPSASIALAITLSSCGVTNTVHPPDPGTVTLHRLNRTEVDRSLRDLFDLSDPVALHLPADDVGNGFDNQANVLSLSSLHLELLDDAVSEMLTYNVLTAYRRYRIYGRPTL